MKFKSAILVVFVLCACRESPKNGVSTESDKIEDAFNATIVKTPGSELDTEKVYLLALDDRKTWRCEFFSNRFVIITNRLRDTFVVRNDLSYQIKNNILLNPFKLSSPEENFSIEILSETCEGRTDNEAVFSDTTKKIMIQLNNRVLSGCVAKVDEITL